MICRTDGHISPFRPHFSVHLLLLSRVDVWEINTFDYFHFVQLNAQQMEPNRQDVLKMSKVIPQF
jgi:hypothetical protein